MWPPDMSMGIHLGQLWFCRIYQYRGGLENIYPWIYYLVRVSDKSYNVGLLTDFISRNIGTWKLCNIYTTQIISFKLCFYTQKSIFHGVYLKHVLRYVTSPSLFPRRREWKRTHLQDHVKWCMWLTGSLFNNFTITSI